MIKEIETTLTRKEIGIRLREYVDFGYSSKLGSITMSKNYYGDKLSKGYYEIWKAPSLKFGIMDWKMTEGFYVKVFNGKIELEMKNNLLIKFVIFLGVGLFIFSFGMNDQFEIPLEYTLICITVIPVLHFFFQRIKRKVIIDDITKFVNENGLS